jgi:hypothetical protein
VSKTQGWSLLGRFDSAARTSVFGMVLAAIIASETFSNKEINYALWMSALILISGGFIGKKALTSQSLLGIFTAIFSLLWLIPLFNSQFFNSVDLIFMLTHSILSLCVAVGAFTYLKN